MAITLMRKNLSDITKNLKSAHAGLLMQRGLCQWEDDKEKKRLREKKEEIAKEKQIKAIIDVKISKLYLLAFNRWLNTTYDKTNFATLSATIDGRLFTGLPLGGALETGAMTHHSYGMPMIAGSSVKGAVRSYAEHLFAERDSEGQICYQDKKVVVQANKQALLDVLFGTDSDDEHANAGYLIWHDAWWIPQITGDGKLATGEHKNRPFTSEIVTVHHQKYYNGDLSEALDIENPIPNQQIAIQGSFYFVIEGESRWAKFAQMLLQDMLVEQGVGAKGSNGYGYFRLYEALDGDIKNRHEMNKPIDLSDPLALIKKELKKIKADELANKLTKGRNKFFPTLGLDKDNNEDCKKLVKAIKEIFPNEVNAWQNAPKGSNAAKAYDFIKKNQ